MRHLLLALAFLATPALAQSVHAANNALFHALGKRRVRIIFVHAGDVIENAFLLLVHALQAVIHNHRQLI